MPRINGRRLKPKPLNITEFMGSLNIPGEYGKERASAYREYVQNKLAGRAGGRAHELTLKDLSEARAALKRHHARRIAEDEERHKERKTA